MSPPVEPAVLHLGRPGRTADSRPVRSGALGSPPRRLGTLTTNAHTISCMSSLPLSHNFPAGCTVPKLSRISALEMLTLNTNTFPKPWRVPRSCPNKGAIMRACRVASHGFQQALILGFRFIITPYHSKACTYMLL